MKVLLIIVGILFLIGLIPLGADFQTDGGIQLKAIVGPVRIGLFPAKKKKKGGKAKEEKPKEEKKDEEKEEDKDKKAKEKSFEIALEDIFELLGIGWKALGRLRRGLHIRELSVSMSLGGDDPYDTALACGYINAALGTLLPLFHHLVRVKKECILIAPRFDSDETDFSAHLTLVIRIGSLVWLSLCAAFSVLRWIIRRRRRLKAEARLSEEDSVEEIARILGGAEVTEAVRENAREMRELAERKKKGV